MDRLYIIMEVIFLFLNSPSKRLTVSLFYSGYMSGLWFAERESQLYHSPWTSSLTS